MTKRSLTVTFILSVLLVLLCHVASTGQEPSGYVVTAAGEKLTFIARPELGYVLKTQQNTFNTEAFSGMLQQFSDAEIKPIRGLGRKGISVVYNGKSADENEKTITALASNNQIRYAAPLFSSNGETVAVIPEVAVRVTAGTNAQELRELCESMGLAIIMKLEFTEQEYLIEVPGTDAIDVFNAVEQLGQISFIEWACPNIAFQPRLLDQVIPNDEYFPNQWDLHNTGQTNGTPNSDINAPEAWEITTGDPNIIIAVLDSGVDANHPDLINNLVPGYDFVDDDAGPDPCLSNPEDGHGTNCAGLIAAQGNNGIGVTGVTWDCKIMPIRILGGIDIFDTDADIATAFRWAANNGADILSNSWGGFFPGMLTHSAIIDVTKQGGIGRDGKGCVVLCSSGNWEGGGPVVFPASYSEVIAVGAVDHDNEVWDYSAFGPELDLVAPSGGIGRADYFFRGKAFQWTTDIMGIYGYSIENLDISLLDYSDSMGGTSGACPIAAGVAALILSVDPNLTNIEVRRIMVESAVDLGEQGWDEYYGSGRVDAFAAVNLALNPQSPTTPPVTPSGVILYIDDDAPNDPGPIDADISDDDEDGSPEHPFDTIQEAIDKASGWDTIIVLDGIYSGAGNLDIDFKGKALTIRSENGPESCIIDCQKLGRGFYFHRSEGANSVLDGLTITNGSADEGGGIYCGSSCSPTITNCVLSGNIAISVGWEGGDGGGMFNMNNRPTITNCTFIGNEAEYGAGMYNYNSSPILAKCTFSENVTVWDGAGMFNDWSNPDLTNCIFRGNSAGDWGGGISNYGGIQNITKCKFSENSAFGYGGGIYNDWNVLTVSNSIFSGNTAGWDGGAMYNDWSGLTVTNCTFAGNAADFGNGNALAFDSYLWSEPSVLELTNCILWDDGDEIWNNDDSTITTTFSDINVGTRSLWPGEGIIKNNPLFADPVNGDYHLKSQAGRWDPASQSWIIDEVSSLCIDAGDPSTPVGSEPLSNGGIINLGAYGGTAEASKSPEN
jgi:predicted outer membrane repeat protein